MELIQIISIMMLLHGHTINHVAIFHMVVKLIHNWMILSEITKEKNQEQKEKNKKMRICDYY
jgi:hypothetical protein